MFSVSCFERPTCLANIVIGTVITFKFVNTCGCVFFMCVFVCEVPFEGVICGVCYVVFQFLILLAIFYVDLLCFSKSIFSAIFIIQLYSVLYSAKLRGTLTNLYARLLIIAYLWVTGCLHDKKYVKKKEREQHLPGY